MIKQVLRLPLVRLFVYSLDVLLSDISFPAVSNLIETSLNVCLYMYVFCRLTLNSIAASLFVHSTYITKKYCASPGFCRG